MVWNLVNLIKLAYVDGVQGMSVLRLLRGFLGWDNFKRGLQVSKILSNFLL